MSTAQRFDILPYGFSKRATNRGDGPGASAAPRVAAADARTGGGGTCSFRAHPAPPVTQAVSWGAKPEPDGNGAGAVWERSRAIKRADEEDTGEEYGGPVVRAKRRGGAGTVQAAGSGGREGLPGAERRGVPPRHVRRDGPVAGRDQEGVQQIAVQLVGLVGRHGQRLVGSGPATGAAPRA